VVDYCRSQGVTIFPGVCTPTDVAPAFTQGNCITVGADSTLMVSPEALSA